MTREQAIDMAVWRVSETRSKIFLRNVLKNHNVWPVVFADIRREFADLCKNGAIP